MADNSLEAYGAHLVVDDELRFCIDTSRVGFDDAWLESMAPVIDDALGAMDGLEEGSIANPAENRQVGHYWLRDPSLAPEASLTKAIVGTRDAVTEFARSVRSGERAPAGAPRFSHFLLVGIGGSALGPQLVADALRTADDGLVPAFLDNTDPDGMTRVLAGLPLASTLVLVVSKSGGTPETRNGMRVTEAAFRKAGLPFPRHAVAVTGVGSALDAYAREQNWLARFEMWDWVGGRTSVMSAVGLLPSSLLGVDIDGFLDGARSMDVLTRRKEIRRNPAAILALAWHRCTGGRSERAMVTLPYKDSLVLLSRYLQQLVMESLGKREDTRGAVVHQGLTVYGNKGSTDQHAFVQQLRDGADDFFVTFVEVLEEGGDGVDVEPGITSGDYLRGFYLGTREALTEAGRPSLTLTVPRVDAQSLGALIALFERAVGLYASMVGINAYDQPGVEAGKRAAKNILDLQCALLASLGPEPRSAADLAAGIGRSGDAELAYLTLRGLAASGRGVSCVGGIDPKIARFRRT